MTLDVPVSPSPIEPMYRSDPLATLTSPLTSSRYCGLVVPIPMLVPSSYATELTTVFASVNVGKYPAVVDDPLISVVPQTLLSIVLVCSTPDDCVTTVLVAPAFRVSIVT